MVQKPYLVVALLVIGIVVGLGVSALVTYTVDQGVRQGPIFSLAHHFPETIGFFILSAGIGLGFNLRIESARLTSRVLGAGVFLLFSVLAVLQLRGTRLPFGVPPLIPFVILLGFVAGYLIDRNYYRSG